MQDDDFEEFARNISIRQARLERKLDVVASLVIALVGIVVAFIGIQFGPWSKWIAVPFAIAAGFVSNHMYNRE